MHGVWKGDEMTKWILIMMFSPMSQYFAGWNIDERVSIESCLTDAKASIGKPLHEVVQMNMAWEKEMMGAEPKVIVAYCAQGAAIQ
jgi:hypothetical protein